MKRLVHIHSDALIREITRYLAAVDAFRTENCEPTWQPELVALDAVRGAGSRTERSGQRQPKTRRP